jgi:hypothetical protein
MSDYDYMGVSAVWPEHNNGSVTTAIAKALKFSLDLPSELRRGMEHGQGRSEDEELLAVAVMEEMSGDCEHSGAPLSEMIAHVEQRANDEVAGYSAPLVAALVRALRRVAGDATRAADNLQKQLDEGCFPPTDEIVVRLASGARLEGADDEGDA